MEWNDEGIILSARPHGETASIAMLLTADHGRHAGLVGGGQGQKSQSQTQPGNHVSAKWRARLLDHLGNYTLDLLTPFAVNWLDQPEVLALISSACAITEASLPERQPMPGVYQGLSALLALTEVDLWGPSYVKWEVGLLRALGYGLDFSSCAVTGETENLTHVSPRTGRSVTAAAATPYKEKLLPLPSFLVCSSEWDDEAIAQGLDLTGHFLSRHVFMHPYGRSATANPGDLPTARQRLTSLYRTEKGRKSIFS